MIARALKLATQEEVGVCGSFELHERSKRPPYAASRRPCTRLAPRHGRRRLNNLPPQVDRAAALFAPHGASPTLHPGACRSRVALSLRCARRPSALGPRAACAGERGRPSGPLMMRFDAA